METSAVGQKRENYLKRNQSHVETATEGSITGLITDPRVTFRNTWFINVNLNHLLTLICGTRAHTKYMSSSFAGTDSECAKLSKLITFLRFGG